MTRLYVCHYSSIKICHDALIGVPCLNPMFAMTHSYESTWDFSPGRNSLVSISTWLNYACSITRLHMPWLIHRCAMPQSYACQDLFIHVNLWFNITRERLSRQHFYPTQLYVCHHSYTYAMTHEYTSWHTYDIHVMAHIRYVCHTSYT